ncbi:thioredoxin domain-containing protein [uncultured Maribacter sp.]|uniref:thioredoxin domain-containing protein n=1 Tax=uncultured Maribacter sp. TaxID=431308 RepID=UPI0030D94A5C|tara:strand:- start:2738 stop:4879 length:2142 start_codon:yes stop_codon:yes gene_type:complete
MNISKRSLLIVFIIIIGSCKNVSTDKNEKSRQENLEIGDFEFTNELIHETSPYLLQHAHNPVDWKPWSESAFELANKENRLVVLSVGYSTCHWCHVMEEESFEDIEVANLMNEKFINIKVDREERPDLDMVYQTALQLVNGTGGWPMNAIILPDGSPIYLGTYHEKEEWKSILAKFSNEFENNPEKIREYATMLANGVQEIYEQPAKQMENVITPDKVKNGIKEWSLLWDVEWGGNKGQQKFILPTNLNMLLDYAVLQQDADAENHVLNTLEKVSHGGIYDHIDGGFFRYSTDNTWKVPHFEKMLYDNAQMIYLLSKAYKLTGNEEYATVVNETIKFLKTEMRNERGGYFSAMDADTNGEEGVYYVWTRKELQELLADDFKLFSKYYGIQDKEVWENENFVLNNTISKEDFSKEYNLALNELHNKIKHWKDILYMARQKRAKPSKDYKIITSWNALLIDGLLEAYKAFGDEKYLAEAKSIFEYIKANNYKNEVLVHSFTTDSKQKEVFLEDYAFLAKSAFALFEVTLDLSYLEISKELMSKAIVKYRSQSELFYYNVSSELVPKIISTSDGVVPSANGIMAQNLFRIGHLEYNTEYLKKAEVMGSLLVSDFENYAVSYGTWGYLFLQQAYPYYEIAIVGSNAEGLITKINSTYLVNTLLVGSSVSSNISLFKDRYHKDGTFIYVCQNNTCKLPVKTVDEVFEQMESFGYQGLR